MLAVDASFVGLFELAFCVVQHDITVGAGAVPAVDVGLGEVFVGVLCLAEEAAFEAVLVQLVCEPSGTFCVLPAASAFFVLDLDLVEVGLGVFVEESGVFAVGVFFVEFFGFFEGFADFCDFVGVLVSAGFGAHVVHALACLVFLEGGGEVVVVFVGEGACFFFALEVVEGFLVGVFGVVVAGFVVGEAAGVGLDVAHGGCLSSWLVVVLYPPPLLFRGVVAGVWIRGIHSYEGTSLCAGNLTWWWIFCGMSRWFIVRGWGRLGSAAPPCGVWCGFMPSVRGR